MSTKLAFTPISKYLIFPGLSLFTESLLPLEAEDGEVIQKEFLND